MEGRIAAAWKEGDITEDGSEGRLAGEPSSGHWVSSRGRLRRASGVFPFRLVEADRLKLRCCGSAVCISNAEFVG